MSLQCVRSLLNELYINSHLNFTFKSNHPILSKRKKTALEATHHHHHVTTPLLQSLSLKYTYEWKEREVFANENGGWTVIKALAQGVAQSSV